MAQAATSTALHRLATSRKVTERDDGLSTYPQVIAVVPGLLAGVQRVVADGSGRARPLLVKVYRLAASLLVKLGEADLGWLAADRAVAAAAGDPVLVAAAAVQLGQVFRASGRAQAALSPTLAAAYRIAPPNPGDGSPGALSLCGTLLVQAALAAARRAGSGRRSVVRADAGAADGQSRRSPVAYRRPARRVAPVSSRRSRDGPRGSARGEVSFGDRRPPRR
ncbi:hypothetical protein ACH4OY_05515 [Micromonospora rubida]|uniref:Uncharacterized protein n=1 Tax=Micromonospora rubida TaxID=2697657 RepID=A0ABW7SEP8_9ACTN